MLRVVTGPPCGGKSSYVADNAQPGAVIVDYDHIATALGAGGHMPEGHIRDAAFAARSAVIDYILRNAADIDAWVIQTSLPPVQREMWENAGAEVVTIDPGVSACLARAVSDERPEGTADAILAYYESLNTLEKAGPRMLRKTVNATVSTGDGEGVVVGYASTWTRTPDAYGDVVAKGAFSRTLAEWRESGRPIPVLWHHDMEDPFAFIGRVIEAVEDEHGLKTVMQLDLENDHAKQVYRLLSQGLVSQMSFAFDILDSGHIELDGVRARELRDVNLYEVSVVPIGANQDTSIEEVKAAADTHLTADEVAALRALLSERETPAEGVSEGNSETVGEAAKGGNSAARLEAVARVSSQFLELDL